MRVLLTANSDWFLYNFRSSLISRLIARGDMVAFACPDGPYRSQLEELGARWFPVSIDRRGMSPWRDIASMRQHRVVVEVFRPDLLHNFTLKSIVAAGLAVRPRRFSGIAVVNNYDGLGYVFHAQSFRARLARLLLRAILLRLNARPHTVTIVLNEEDRDRFAREKIAPPERTQVIAGTGIDLARFQPRTAPPEIFTILYASRLLYSKGVSVLIDAVDELRREEHTVLLRIAGAVDEGNPESVSESKIASWAERGLAEMLGQRRDVDRLIANSSVVVLVSRNEGLPTILAEAGASAVPVITSGQGGCREIVSDGVNGLVVPTDDPAALARALYRLIADPVLADTLGRNGRRIVEERFSEKAINGSIIALYDNLTQNI